MAPSKAKLVTIITVYEARERVVAALTTFGVRGHSVEHVEGQGVHGHHLGGFFESKNLAFKVVVADGIELKLLAWVEAELIPRFPSIAYSADVLAVPGDHF